MAKIETYRCDVCSAIKQEANHWWTLSTFTTWGTTAIIQPWADSLVWIRDINCGGGNLMTFHLCGQDCVNRKLAEIMKQSSGPNTADRSEGCPVALQEQN